MQEWANKCKTQTIENSSQNLAQIFIQDLRKQKYEISDYLVEPIYVILE